MNMEAAITSEEENAVTVRSQRRRVRRVLMLAAPVAVAVGALYFYLTGGRYESTENASLQSGMVAVSPSIAGKVVSIEVTENQRVRAGDVLFRVASDTFNAAVAQATAELADARTDIASTRADYQEALSQVSAAEARYAYAQNEVARQGSLVKEGIASRQQYDSALTDARTAKDTIASARAKADSLRAALGGTVDGPTDQQPKVQKAASALQRARISLGDTVIRAPVDGIVTRVNQLQVGNYVQPGRPVFMLTGLKYWIQANFKENQLRYMRVGQPAEIKVDAFPDRKLKGHVESFSPGTGSSFSILPAENATGNWVKVVQRLPVQVALDEVPQDLPLSAGLSVEVDVDTGHQRHLFGSDTPPTAPAQKASQAGTQAGKP